MDRPAARIVVDGRVRDVITKMGPTTTGPRLPGKLDALSGDFGEA